MRHVEEFKQKARQKRAPRATREKRAARQATLTGCSNYQPKEEKEIKNADA